MIPLSIEKESVGKPFMFQCQINTGSPIVFCKEKFEEDLISRFINS